MVPLQRCLCGLLLVFTLSGSATRAADESSPDFALKDGDRVVFVGDSITAARDYPKTIELYTLLRFPDRKVAFFNGGKGGDTATTAITRLQRDVFDRQATVVTVALGLNDIGWGLKADQEHKQAYLDGIRSIVEQCQAQGIRVYVCSPAITAEDPERAETGFLQKMADEGLQLATSLGAKTIDLQRGMRAIQRTIQAANQKVADKSKHTRLHADDGVHLNSLGQLAMAYVMLKGLGAPAEVSAAAMDASSIKVTATRGCTVSNLVMSEGQLTFDRLDEGYPLNRGVFAAFDHRWVPIPDGLNRYTLSISHLPAVSYQLIVNQRPVRTLRAEALARGVNLSSMTANGWEPGGPWEAQAHVLKELVDARDRVALSQLFQTAYGSQHPQLELLRKQAASVDEGLVNLQRETARPIKLRFELRPATEKP